VTEKSEEVLKEWLKLSADRRLLWSAEELFGWRSQLDRIKRWQLRLLNLTSEQKSQQDELDIYLAFFVACYSMRDWLVASSPLDANVIDKEIAASEHMRLCRDICNRSKHKIITKYSIDPDFSIAREYRGEQEPTELIIVTAKGMRDLKDVMQACVRFWEGLLLVTICPSHLSLTITNHPRDALLRLKVMRHAVRQWTHSCS